MIASASAILYGQQRAGTARHLRGAPLPSRAQRDSELLSAMRCKTSIAGAPRLFAQSIKRQSPIEWTSTMRAFFPPMLFPSRRHDISLHPAQSAIPLSLKLGQAVFARPIWLFGQHRWAGRVLR